MDDIYPPQVSVTRSASRLLVVTVDGEIDRDTTPMVSIRLLQAVTTPPVPDTVVVDLSDVVFFAAAGLHLLADVADVCGRHGSRVRLVVTPGTAPAYVIGTTSFTEVIPTFDTLAQALNA